ncbi:MAG: tRNA preQ1(34) S-adenosylmethionine ribosyltransferase-isomerase QueA [Eubacteriales bacterium]|nr:tRNA preQ1(34) S-adenosylmethionine ribosyltransferase-isomerase QueA [Eubacteriales bacterium]MDD3199930.1 tRNA preQ1(34) S-adenosylmethionine ribosyltransferase-isomerase QueA [Eubacteriales bacterium]MDD4122347.1 tRNA preQ1(34) S-adenosylmethionine ribosyltransferase-isomerase QueA [Eubacteriales bacterium]MDD4630564.1 tRNA preQ1(34) S-adenosylmethionine ribosyltransferase-isomerase QueA [Eubacteriales bacterium]
MNINDFDYDLPDELIAQHPADKRDESRLLIVDRKTGNIKHRHFYDLLDHITPGDCLIMNNSKVIPARLFGIKEMTGARVEFLLVKRINNDIWEAMVRPGKKLHIGDRVSFTEDGSLSAEILDHNEGGTRIVQFKHEENFSDILERIGKIPLPPYIERDSDDEDKIRYQTVYCKQEGSVAAPTAGLHFTEELIQKTTEKGVNIAYVTLHVGIGTFRPVKCDKIEEHKMHFEEYEIDEENASIINETKKSGGRIISVGTTSARTVESAAGEQGMVQAGHGKTDIFIYPGYQFKVIDSLITNFHLPKSTLLMLISALYNREKIIEVYQEAVEQKYRFFSYGDAMFII